VLWAADPCGSAHPGLCNSPQPSAGDPEPQRPADRVPEVSAASHCVTEPRRESDEDARLRKLRITSGNVMRQTANGKCHFTNAISAHSGERSGFPYPRVRLSLPIRSDAETREKRGGESFCSRRLLRSCCEFWFSWVPMNVSEERASGIEPTHGAHAIEQNILVMMRRAAPVAEVVAGSTPVIAFGDPFRATVATLGINPSRREFLDTNGELLSRSSASPCDACVATCRGQRQSQFRPGSCLDG
jgi:hypothetical protein